MGHNCRALSGIKAHAVKQAIGTVSVEFLIKLLYCWMVSKVFQRFFVFCFQVIHHLCKHLHDQAGLLFLLV
ncbi:hypothetical protein D3C87_2079630 [compost metagenome]